MRARFQGGRDRLSRFSARVQSGARAGVQDAGLKHAMWGAAAFFAGRAAYRQRDEGGLGQVARVGITLVAAAKATKPFRNSRQFRR